MLEPKKCYNDFMNALFVIWDSRVNFVSRVYTPKGEREDWVGDENPWERGWSGGAVVISLAPSSF